MKPILTILHALWLGAHITVGYVVAPLLFQYAEKGELTRQTAGNIAGDLFHMVVYLGLVTTGLWWWFCRKMQQPSLLLNAMLLLLALSEWVISPVINAIKHQQHHWLHDLLGGSFGVWHGVSSSVYLLLTLLLLVWTWQRVQTNSQRR